jgi:hypothetical protein
VLAENLHQGQAAMRTGIVRIQGEVRRPDTGDQCEHYGDYDDHRDEDADPAGPAAD